MIKNSWCDISLSDYENHMCEKTVMQLQLLNQIMKEQLSSYPCKTVMILGVAGGNGLEHVNSQMIQQVYAIDVNQKYLDACMIRYQNLKEILSCLNIDLRDENVTLPHVELLIANLLIEYIGITCFEKRVKQIKPFYISCVIQESLDENFISQTPSSKVFAPLQDIHFQISLDTLKSKMLESNYRLEKYEEKIMPNGKKLVQLDFKSLLSNNKPKL